MGWLFPYGATRKSLIADRIEGWQRDTDEMTIKSECLRHCFRGGRFSGVLWSVWKQTFTKDGIDVQPERRFINCDLLEYARRHEGWGYKDLDESMHPFYYSCPLSYLALVPIDQFGGNAEWRKIVVEYHRRQREKRKRKSLIA